MKSVLVGKTLGIAAGRLLEGCICESIDDIVSTMLLVPVFGCERKAPLKESSVERGKCLVTLGECNVCHTPKMPGPGGAPEPDAKRLISGHPRNAPHPAWTPEDAKRNVLITANGTGTAFAGPWGVSFAINLTPDKGSRTAIVRSTARACSAWRCQKVVDLDEFLRAASNRVDTKNSF